MKRYVEPQIDIPGIIDRMDFLLKQRGQKREDAAEAIGKNKQVFTNWRSKNISPTANDLYFLSKFLMTTYDYLLLGESDSLPDDIATVVSLLSQLNEDQRKPIIELIVNQVELWKKVLNIN